MEIENEMAVNVILKFSHPKYEAEQKLLFNSNNDMMLEMIRGEFCIKAILYEKDSSMHSSNVEWQIIR